MKNLVDMILFNQDSKKVFCVLFFLWAFFFVLFHEPLNAQNYTESISIQKGSMNGRAQMILRDDTSNEIWRFGLTGQAINDFNFFDGSANVLSLNANGDIILRPSNNVGIGTDNPSYKLDALGNVRAQYHLITGSSGNNGRLYIRDNSEANKILLQSDGDSYFNSGFIGIGTVNPTAPLQIKQAGPRALRLERDGHDMYEIKLAGTQGIHFTNLTDNRAEMIFDGTGSIGIGTTSPDSRLTVKGGIHAEEVRVDLNVPGPDYVFEEDYDLPTLKSLQNYIRENKHLPEVPSAQAMEENGIDLGVMNMLLLKKVEELTLYTLEQEANINKLKKEKIILKKSTEGEIEKLLSRQVKLMEKLEEQNQRILKLENDRSW